MKRLILASGSPQRKRLLAEAGYDFEIIVPEECEPDRSRYRDAGSYAAHTAWLKAQQVSKDLSDGLILAADTVVAISGQIIGKPADEADARRILELLSGTVHQCVTGVCLWNLPENFWIGGLESTDLSMRPLTPAEIEAYLHSRRWEGKAGAYGIQDPDPYVSIHRGSHSNVVGLPMELVSALLHKLRYFERIDK